MPNTVACRRRHQATTPALQGCHCTVPVACSTATIRNTKHTTSFRYSSSTGCSTSLPAPQSTKLTVCLLTPTNTDKIQCHTPERIHTCLTLQAESVAQRGMKVGANPTCMLTCSEATLCHTVLHRYKSLCTKRTDISMMKQNSSSRLYVSTHPPTCVEHSH